MKRAMINHLKIWFAAIAFLMLACFVLGYVAGPDVPDLDPDPDRTQATADSVTDLGRESRSELAHRVDPNYGHPYRQFCAAVGAGKESCR